MNEILEKIRRVLRDVWLHRWVGLVVAWIVVIVGAIAVYLMPDQYQATARVYVDTQSILRPLMSGLAVELNTDQQIMIMSRTLISRPNIEKVVSMSDLDLQVKTPEQKEALIDSLTRKIELQNTGGINLYSISLKDSKPETAKKIVQSLLTIFVESNLGSNRKDTDTAKSFLDDQIKAYEQKLEAAENALKDFKIHNMGTMPGSGKDYYTQMSEAATELAQARLSLSEAENARDALKRQMVGEEPVFLGDGDNQGSSPEIDSRIANLKQKLDELRLQYTEQHPDIVGTKRIIADLEQQKKKEMAARAKTTPAIAKSGLGGNPVYQQIQIQVAQRDAEVASLRARVGSYEARYQQLKNAAVSVPKVEADYQQLNRDYAINKANYEKLLASRESAQMSSEMDSNAGAVEFRVVDPPRVDPVPVAPNRMLLMSLVFLGSLGGGLAVAFLLSQIKPTVSDRKMLREITGLPVLGAVAMIWTPDQIQQRRRQLTAFSVGLSGLVGAYGVWLAFFTIRAAQFGSGRLF